MSCKRYSKGVTLSLVVVLLVSMMLITPTVTQASNEWQAGINYQIGDLATYENVVYKCLQAHSSLVGWEPPNVPALWSVTDEPTPTPTPTQRRLQHRSQLRHLPRYQPQHLMGIKLLWGIGTILITIQRLSVYEMFEQILM